MMKLVVLFACVALGSASHLSTVVDSRWAGAPGIIGGHAGIIGAAPALARANILAAPAVAAAPAISAYAAGPALAAPAVAAVAAPAIAAAPVVAARVATPAVVTRPIVGQAISRTVHYAPQDVVTGYTSTVLKPDLGRIATPLNTVTQQRVVAPARSVQTIVPQITQVEPEVSVQRVAVDVPVRTPVVSEVEVRTPVVHAPAVAAVAAAPAVAAVAAAPAIATGHLTAGHAIAAGPAVVDARLATGVLGHGAPLPIARTLAANHAW